LWFCPSHSRWNVPPPALSLDQDVHGGAEIHPIASILPLGGRLRNVFPCGRRLITARRLATDGLASRLQESQSAVIENPDVEVTFVHRAMMRAASPEWVMGS
jgi:hypothetical protein